MTSNTQAIGDAISLVWPGQADFLLSEANKTLLFTGASYGKSKILCEKIIYDHSKMDYWWVNRAEYNTNPIIFMVGAAHEAYLAENTVPLFRAALDQIEGRIGRSLRKRTGRDRDGWYGSVGHRRQEMANCVDIIIKAFPTKENAVAVTVAGLYFDEITMFSDPEIWRRSLQRVRDPRVTKKANGRPNHFIAAVGTPEEDHWIYELVVDPVTKRPYPGCKVILGSTLSNPLIDINWFSNQALSSQTFKDMQVMGQWVAGAGGQRFANIFTDRHIVSMAKPVNPRAVQYDIGWDPGYRTGAVVVGWQRPRDDTWFLVDEVTISGATTNEVCDMLMAKGYDRRNIRSISMDPRDANKQKSTSRVTDAQIVYDKFGIRPKAKSVGNSEVQVRLDVLEDMFRADRLFISDELLPRNSSQICLVNALKNFATRKMKADGEKFTDSITRDTMERWKHHIDAVHYMLMHYERGVYTRVLRNPDQKAGI